jgi:hypothetical protein
MQADLHRPQHAHSWHLRTIQQVGVLAIGSYGRLGVVSGKLDRRLPESGTMQEAARDTKRK